jgi:ADP-ribose pyrophosphatase YjhB (NUDIX family)
VLYFNPAAAVAALIVRDDGRALFIRRAKEPARGRLGMPGGFVDEGEGAEEALRREVREETGLVLHGLEYLGSHPNRYPYEGVTYHTVDLFFVGSTDEPERAAALDQVDDILWLDPFEVPLEELAFESMRAALAVYRERYRRPLEG